MGLKRKDFIIELLFKYAKLAKFIRYEALWELLFKQTFFYHKVHGEQVKWWRFWGFWGTSEILHYSTLRSEWHGSVFYLRLGICFSGRIIFETQRFFFLNCFFKWAKLAKFIRFEALWELLFKQTFFYRKVHGDVVKWLHFWELWGTSEMFWEGHGYSVGRCRKTFSLMKRFFTALCLVQNDRGSIFCSRLGIYIIGGFFWIAKIFFLELLF